MRMLCSMSFATEVDRCLYAANAYTEQMARPEFEGGMIVTTDLEPTECIPEYFQKRGYKCPTDSSDCTFQYKFGPEASYFGNVSATPRNSKAFGDWMKVIRTGRHFWSDWYDVQHRLMRDFNAADEGPFMVDLGGGSGHDLEDFLKKFPLTHDRLVLQDLEHAIQTTRKTLSPGIKPMVHDFFKEQPLKGTPTTIW